MPKTGNKKIAPKYIKKDAEIQFCIDGYLAHDVLNQIDEDKIKIIGAKIAIGKSFSKRKRAIPNAMKKLGVNSMYENMPTKMAFLTFDRIKKSVLIKRIDAVSKMIDADPDGAWIKYITLDNGKGAGKFERCTKEIKPYDEDQRRKLTVLGLTDARDRIQSLISDLGAKKFGCKFQVVEVRTIICSQLN